MSAKKLKEIELSKSVTWTVFLAIVTILMGGIGWAILISNSAYGQAQSANDRVTTISNTLEGVKANTDFIKSLLLKNKL